MNVAIRVDASIDIGTGHVIRCLTLAESLRNLGAQCEFICREHPGHLMGQVQQNGFKVSALPIPTNEGLEVQGLRVLAKVDHANWLGVDWVVDAEQTKSIIYKRKFDLLIVDHYAIDKLWEGYIKPYCGKLFVIDDLADRAHNCDYLLDQNLVENLENRYVNKVPKNCVLMLGPEFSILQSQFKNFRDLAPARTGKINRVMVYFGGSDPSNLTGMVANIILSLEPNDVFIDLIIGINNPNKELIRRQVQNQANVSLHLNLTSLADLMARSDLFIGASGATTWERCCMGLPSLVITVANNQKAVAKELDRRSIVRWIGHVGDIDTVTLTSALRELFISGINASWSIACKALVDGKGANRVCNFLQISSKTKLRARRAEFIDEKLVLRWANDPKVRSQSFNPKKISASSHHEWFKSRLEKPNQYQLFIIETEDEIPVGQVRFEKIDGNWEIDYSLDALFRGRKVGKELLRAGLEALSENKKGANVLGRVKRENYASIRIFESLEFKSKKYAEETVFCSSV